MAGTRLRPVGEGGHIIEDEGTPLAQQPALNFLGAGVTAVDGSGKTNVTIPGGGGGNGHIIQDEGTPLAQQTVMNFVGAGVEATDVGGKTVVTIDGGGGVWTKVADSTLGVAGLTMTATPTSAITPASVREIYVIAEFQMAVSGTAVLSMGGVVATIQNKGVKSTGAAVSAINRATGADIGSGETITTDTPVRFVYRIGVNNTPQSGLSGDFVESVPFGSEVYRTGTFGSDSSFTSITDFVLTASQNMVAASRITVYTLSTVGGGGGGGVPAQGSVDHFALAHMLGEKYINETWFYSSVAEILLYWDSAFGTITRGSDNFINITSGVGTGAVGVISTAGSWDVRVSPSSIWDTVENVMVFKTQVIMIDFGSADYFFGAAVTVTNNALTATDWYEALNGAIGFITIGTALFGYIQNGAGPGNNESIDLSIVIDSGQHNYEWRNNSSGFIEFFYDGVLVGTSANSPDKRPLNQMSPTVAVRGSTDQARCYGISMSCKNRAF